MTRKIFALAAMLVTLLISAVAFAAIPSINHFQYIKTYGLSSGNDTPVFTNSRLNQRGTSNPSKAYNATIYANDEIWILAMNDNFALIAYPTNSGRRQGYVHTSALTSNNFSKNAQRARGRINDIYLRPGTRYSNSYISSGDNVWTVARQGNYTQVVYPTGNTYKMAWITNSDYDNYIAPKGNGGTNLKGDVNNDGKVDSNDVNLMRQYMVNAVGDSAINKNNADLNNDGEVDVADYAMLLDIVNRSQGNVNHNPQGSVNSADSPAPYTLHVKGTAFDEDNPSGSTRLHVYVGGTPGSSVPQYEIRTNGSNRVFEDTRTIDRNYAGRQLVHVYALNDYGEGTFVEIWNGYVDIQAEGGNGKLQELINRWDGRKWQNGYSRSSQAEKRLISGAIECKEFASYIFNILYNTGYVGSGSTSSNYYNWRLNDTPSRVYQVAEVSQTNNASQAREAFKNLFAKAQPGDFIQIKRGGGGAHSAIFVRRTDNGIQWLDANADGANSIRLQTYSYDDLVKTTSRGYQWNVAMSLYRAR